MAKSSKPISKPRLIHWAIAGAVAVGLGVGLVGGYFIRPSQIVSSSQSIRQAPGQYEFIDPLLAVERTGIATASPAYGQLQSAVKTYIAGQKASGALSSASVYFINYGRSGSFAINENEAYDPASMLKVVVMVAYLSEADTDASVLDKPLVYSQAIDDSTEAVAFADPSELKVGTTYTVDALIRSMIVDSDNGAMNLLIDNISPDYLNRVYTDLGLTAPVGTTAYTISAKDYSLFFRVLYNATYLSRANSEKALSLLSEATFKDGLVSGMPAGTVVAHKFGEHVVGTGSTITSVELHDCGIVYVPNGPYLLCVMTKGPALGGLETAIAGISKLVYADVTGAQAK